MFIARPIDTNGSNYMIGIINKTSKNNVTSNNQITSKRDIIVVIINLTKYPDIIFMFPASD